MCVCVCVCVCACVCTCVCVCVCVCVCAAIALSIMDDDGSSHPQAGVVRVRGCEDQPLRRRALGDPAHVYLLTGLPACAPQLGPGQHSPGPPGGGEGGGGREERTSALKAVRYRPDIFVSLSVVLGLQGCQWNKRWSDPRAPHLERPTGQLPAGLAGRYRRR